MSNLSSLFHDHKAIVFFDTETSGLDPETDQIIELAALRAEQDFAGGLYIVDAMDRFIKLPEGKSLPDSIVAMTGITDRIAAHIRARKERMMLSEKTRPRHHRAKNHNVILLAAVLLLILIAYAATAHLSAAGQQSHEYESPTPPPLTSQVVQENATAEPAAAPTTLVESTPAPRYALSTSERDTVERIVMAEAGGEPYDGQMLVAQCILNAAEKCGKDPSEAAKAYQYTSARPEPTQSVRDAVAAVFDRGETVTDAPVLYFYNPSIVTSTWHESQSFVIEVGGHRFFTERK